MAEVAMKFLAVGIALILSACATHIPAPAGGRGTPDVTWVIMSGDRDNPDQDFVCQSNQPGECVVPASRPDAQVFSHFHVYFHRAGSETKYTGSIQTGYFQGSPASQRMQTDTTVKNESIVNHSVIGIVTSTPGT